MAQSIATPAAGRPRGNTRKAMRGNLLRAGAMVPALALALALPVLAVAQEQNSGNRHFTAAPAATAAQAQGKGSRHFTAAPVPASGEEESADSIEAAIGISTNALFFTAVAVIGLFWFTVGGGRRARKLGRQE